MKTKIVGIALELHFLNKIIFNFFVSQKFECGCCRIRPQLFGADGDEHICAKILGTNSSSILTLICYCFLTRHRKIFQKFIWYIQIILKSDDI